MVGGVLGAGRPSADWGRGRTGEVHTALMQGCRRQDAAPGCTGEQGSRRSRRSRGAGVFLGALHRTGTPLRVCLSTPKLVSRFFGVKGCRAIGTKTNITNFVQS